MKRDRQRESTLVPWDVIVNRLDRYLRLRYASAVLAGLVLAAEIAVLVIPGSPAHRRAEIAGAATSVAHWDLGALILLLASAATLIGAYFVGAIARALTFAVVLALVNTITLIRSELRRWWRGGFEGLPLSERAMSGRSPRCRWEAKRRRLSKALPRPWRRPWSPPPTPNRAWQTFKALGISVGRSLLQPFLPIVMRPHDLWLVLDWTYGADTVNRMLSRHPLKVRVDVEDLSSDDRSDRERARYAAASQVAVTWEYCQLWLQRYAPDIAIPPRATRALVLGTAALPASLLPRSLYLVGADVTWISPLLGPLRVLLLVGAVILFLGVLREVAYRPATMFQRFVVLELAEQARRDTTTTEETPDATTTQ
jgi:hypothetical protein